MKYIKLSIFVSGLAIILTSAINKSGGAPGCHAGEAPNFTSCNNCHSDKELNTGDAKISFDLGGLEDGYLSEETYTITISIEKEGLKAGGFQTITLEDRNLNSSPGKIILTDTEGTQVNDRNNPHAHGCAISNKAWVTHTFRSITTGGKDKLTWSYDWVSPKENIGDITFYLSVLEADLDFTKDGDYTYTKNIKVAPHPTLSRDNVVSLEKNTTIYPNPTTGDIVVNSDKSIREINVLSLSGTTIKTLQIEDFVLSIPVDCSELSNGIYLLVLKGEDFQTVKRLVVQK